MRGDERRGEERRGEGCVFFFFLISWVLELKLELKLELVLVGMLAWFSCLVASRERERKRRIEIEIQISYLVSAICELRVASSLHTLFPFFSPSPRLFTSMPLTAIPTLIHIHSLSSLSNSSLPHSSRIPNLIIKS